MARLPRLEFAAEVILAGLPQFAHDARILYHQPVLQFIQRVHGFQDFGRNLNRVAKRFHAFNHTTVRCPRKPENSTVNL